MSPEKKEIIKLRQSFDNPFVLEISNEIETFKTDVQSLKETIKTDVESLKQNYDTLLQEICELKKTAWTINETSENNEHSLEKIRKMCEHYFPTKHDVTKYFDTLEKKIYESDKITSSLVSGCVNAQSTIEK